MQKIARPVDLAGLGSTGIGAATAGVAFGGGAQPLVVVLEVVVVPAPVVTVLVGLVETAGTIGLVGATVRALGPTHVVVGIGVAASLVLRSAPLDRAVVPGGVAVVAVVGHVVRRAAIVRVVVLGGFGAGLLRGASAPLRLRLILLLARVLLRALVGVVAGVRGSREQADDQQQGERGKCSGTVVLVHGYASLPMWKFFQARLERRGTRDAPSVLYLPGLPNVTVANTDC
ncbi:MAG: hypothetical protein ABR575_07000 [Actinomycetota bacterium]